MGSTQSEKADKPFNPSAEPELRKVKALPAALLLAATGGSLDAFLYLGHGHVFAGAMTGNAVLCGIALLSHEPREMIQHMLPIAAFAVGAYGAQVMGARLGSKAVAVGLGCEAAGLLGASLLPASVPNLLFVPLVSMLTGYQVASFKKVEDISYNSTFITGNMRGAIEGLYALRTPEKRADGLRTFRELTGVVAAFLAGAICGAAIEPHIGNHTLWLPVCLLLLVLAWVLRADPARNASH